MRVVIAPETVDHLGRILPEKSVDLVDIRTMHLQDIVSVLAIAAQYGMDESYRLIREAAIAAGFTHRPADLAGRRCPM
jgi:hypothetical protein